MDETKYWMWLSMVFCTGSRRIWEAMCLFTSAQEAFEMLTDGSVVLKLTEKEWERLRSTPLSAAAKFVEKCRNDGVEVIGYSDKLYPSQLRHLFNPPAILYYKGNISCLTGTKTITTVGTRSASDYGMRAAETICSELAAKNFVIVSGFAVGIDIATHMAAAGRKRPTACVMGCGVDVDYPKPNQQFREKILQCGGVFISEFPPGTQPHPQNFPSRNRILAGLGRAALVFEASVKSGSLITARLACEQGRDVLVLPPPDIFSSRYSGNIQLLRDGAEPFYGAEEILELYKLGSPVEEEIRDSIEAEYTGREAGIVWAGRTDIEADGNEELPVKKTRKRPKKAREEIPSVPEEKTAADADDTDNDELTDIQRRIVTELRDGSLHADEICRRLDIDSAELMTELTELEIVGAVRSLPGKMYELYR